MIKVSKKKTGEVLVQVPKSKGTPVRQAEAVLEFLRAAGIPTRGIEIEVDGVVFEPEPKVVLNKVS